ncbi:MAG: two-component regulator propeller domain-containing protein [Balneola sp.]
MGVAHKRTGLVFFMIFFWGIFCSSMAQIPQFSATHYNSENIGLSHNTVQNMTTDSYGFVWVSTMDGLNRFDGKAVKIYRHIPNDSTTLSDSFIHGIFEHRNGKFLIGTRDGGINILDPKTDQIERADHRANNTIPAAPVNVIFEDSKEFLWVGFFTNRIGFFDLETRSYYPANLTETGSGEPIYSVNSILELNDGAFLLSSLNGIFYVSSEEVNKFRLSPTSEQQIFANRILYSKSNPAPNTDIIFMDSDGDVWVRVVTDDLRKLSRNRFPGDILKSIESGSARSSVTKQFLERGDYLLKGHVAGSIKIIHKKTEEEQIVQVADISGVVGASKLYEDYLGNIWFYTWGGGFFRLKEKKGISLITNSENQELLPSTFVLAFEDEQDGIWVGTNNGLTLLTKDGSSSFQEYKEPGSIWSLERDELGLWIATRTNGLYLLKENAIRERDFKGMQFTAEESPLAMDNVHQVVRDSRGWLWLGYQGEGIQVIQNVKDWIEGSPANVFSIQRNSAEISINSNSIRKIYEDKEGNMWVATTDNGINYLKIEEGKITNIKVFEPDSELSHRDARSIYHQDDSTFWFASYGGGITRWKREKEELLNLRTPEGLPNNSVYGILGDENPDYVWVSTNNGLGRLNTKTLSFTNFTDADGLQNNEFNTGAFYKSSTGELLFGGVNGLNQIDTEALELNTEPPRVFLTGINLFNEPINIDSSAIFIKQLELPYNQNFLSFEFAALDYEEPLGNLYAYRMEGIDADWVHSGNRNFADYPNLAPGKYTFRVKAANTNGAWNEKGTLLHINLLPPWWQTWWFRTIFGSLMLLGFIGLIRYYSQRKLKEELRQLEIRNKLRNERERISRDLHDHVGAQLANIISGLSLIDKYVEVDEREKSIKMMKSLKGDAEVTIKQLRETIWALNQNEIALEGFITHLNTYFKNQSALMDQLTLTMGYEGEGETLLSATQALNLFRIIQEASQNTLKYANAKQLDISFKAQNGSLEVRIKDDGVFQSDLQSFNGGYGMKNMQKRAREIQGEVEINTDSGTEVKISLPLKGS